MSDRQERLRVLIVDDDEVDRMALRRALAAADIDADVIEAADASQALVSAAAAPPDVIFVDYLLPTMTGADLVLKLKEIRPPLDAPIIALTGMGDETVAVALMKAGAADYIRKGSLSPERLAGSIRSGLGLRRAERATRRTEAELRRYVRKLRALTEAAPRINATLEREELIATAASEACRVLDARRAYVGVHVPDETSAEATAPGRVSDDAPSAPPPWRALQDLARDAKCACRIGARSLAVLGEPAGDAAGRPPRGALIVPLAGRAGEIIGVLAVVDALDADFGEADLAVATQLAQTLQVALENARLHAGMLQAMRACDELRAIACHDLRNPLGSIQLGATMLREIVPGNEEVDEVMRRMEVATSHMQRLIADFLDGARFESKGLVVKPGEVPVSELVDAATALVAARADAAGVRLETRIDGASGAVSAERDRALQVLSNLLVNAIKFTPRGGRVELAVAPEQGEVRFTVRDTGPGIPSEHVPHVFEMFWQLSGRREGVGLGLYIAKTIVEAHGGRIWVDGGAGHGAAFHFTVPAAS